MFVVTGGAMPTRLNEDLTGSLQTPCGGMLNIQLCKAV